LLLYRYSSVNQLSLADGGGADGVATMEKRDILVVHPDRDICSLLTLMLSDDGYSVTCAHSVKRGAELLAAGHFDLVLVDAFDQREMFDFDDAFLDDLRKANETVPILFCSTHASGESLHAGDSGFAAIIALPNGLDRLMETIKKALGDR
jgi:DNA-binding NtrC family response regulator